MLLAIICVQSRLAVFTCVFQTRALSQYFLRSRHLENITLSEDIRKAIKRTSILQLERLFSSNIITYYTMLSLDVKLVMAAVYEFMAFFMQPHRVHFYEKLHVLYKCSKRHNTLIYHIYTLVYNLLFFLYAENKFSETKFRNYYEICC